MGSSGPNVVLSIFSIYFCSHATLAIIRHLNKFKPQPFPVHHVTQQEAIEKNTEAETEEVDSSETQLSGKAIISDSNLSDNHTLVVQISAFDVIESSNDGNKSRLSRPLSSKPAFQTRNTRYNVTKAVILRLVIFISGYVIVDLDTSIGVILSVVKKKPVDLGERYVCAVAAILVCLIFGTTDKTLDRWFGLKWLKWVKNKLLSSREKVINKENEVLSI
ncbi:3761_t:CDS:1 [Paraglomus brasilianum]|uniref:3761_t:CDS:1 n=1 Tax=Paraglomus brasilianum TaxID=144538 RepID=A0A9N8ZRV3_9GLOM|nr:3761_t:CDS:1 [Paraglomus brasilianum]